MRSRAESWAPSAWSAETLASAGTLASASAITARCCRRERQPPTRPRARQRAHGERRQQRDRHDHESQAGGEAGAVPSAGSAPSGAPARPPMRRSPEHHGGDHERRLAGDVVVGDRVLLRLAREQVDEQLRETDEERERARQGGEAEGPEQLHQVGEPGWRQQRGDDAPRVRQQARWRGCACSPRRPSNRSRNWLDPPPLKCGITRPTATRKYALAAAVIRSGHSRRLRSAK